MSKYKINKRGDITKDGHTMFKEDIVRDLNRLAFLEKNQIVNKKVYKV